MDFEDVMGLFGGETPEQRAARALADAVRADTTGRPLTLRSWGSVVKGDLGVKKLHKKRMDEVVAEGERLKLFTVRKGIITMLDPPPEPEKPAPAPQPEKPAKKPKTRKRQKAPPEPEKPKDEEPEPKDEEPEPKPEKKDGPLVHPEMMECGHFNFHKEKDGSCSACKTKSVPDWRFLSENADTPIPERLRRTEDKMASSGYGGLCCTPEGYYIGGVGNDCRYYRPPGVNVCAYHKNRPKG